MKKRIVYFAIIIAIISGSLTFFAGCVPTGDAVSYVMLSVNPSVEFVVDTADRVVTVNAINDDGELLFSLDNFKGVLIDKAIERMVELASKSGQLNVEASDNVIYVSVVNENAEKANNLYNRIKARTENFCKTNGIYGLVSKGQLSDEVLNLATEYNVSPGHLRIMLKALELNPDLEMEELIEMTIPEIITELNVNLLGYGQICLKEYKDAFKVERLALRDEYMTDVQALFGNEYANLIAELELLESQLESVDGIALENLVTSIDDKKSQIQTLKASLQETYSTELETLKQSYEEDKKSLINKYKDQCQAQKESLKASFENLIALNKLKFEQRREYAKERVNDFANKYEEWKALKESDLFNFIRSKIEELQEMYEETNDDVSSALAEADKYKNLYEYNNDKDVLA